MESSSVRLQDEVAVTSSIRVHLERVKTSVLIGKRMS